MNYVIIGNSAAGIGAAEALRIRDREADITIISDEEYHTYSRPLISYLLLGKVTREKMNYRGADFYEKNGIKFMGGRRVENINADSHVLTLEDGELVPYGKLLVATGSSPFVPPIEGLENVANKFTFMSLNSALVVGKTLSQTPNAKVLIVGAGLIGLKCAEGIRGKTGKITVIDLAPRILSSILDGDGAAVVQRHLEKEGIGFVLGDSVSKFEKNRALTAAGRELNFDILIMAVGVRPNTELVKNAGGKVNRGIVADECMRTSLADVFAAGDCAESFDISCGQNRVLALLPNAYIQGETAGLAMSGFEKPYTTAIPLNAIGFFGLNTATAGSYDGEVYENITENNYKKLFYKDDVLKGFIIIGNVEKCGVYTDLIRQKTPLSSLDFGLICEKPGLMAFSREARIQKLATSNVDGYGGIF